MSKSQLNVNHAADVEIVRAGNPMTAEHSRIDPRGKFVVAHYRNGKRLNEYVFPNGITNEGKNRLLDVMFHGTTQLTTWYLGLIDNSGYSALAAGDNYDNINQAGNGWDEFDDYTDGNNSNNAGTRPLWDEGAASSQSITNGSVAIFDITSAGTVKGVFVVAGTSAQTKNDHSAGSAHVLWATALFNGGDVAVQNGDQLKITYTVSA